MTLEEYFSEHVKPKPLIDGKDENTHKPTQAKRPKAKRPEAKRSKAKRSKGRSPFQSEAFQRAKPVPLKPKTFQSRTRFLLKTLVVIKFFFIG
jgi:hypothetical protein